MFKIANAFKRTYLQQQLDATRQKLDTIYPERDKVISKRNEAVGKLGSAKDSLRQIKEIYNQKQEEIKKNRQKTARLHQEIEQLRKRDVELFNASQRSDGKYWGADSRLAAAQRVLEENAEKIEELNDALRKLKASSQSHVSQPEHKPQLGWDDGSGNIRMRSAVSERSTEEILREMQNRKKLSAIQEELTRLKNERPHLESRYHTARIEKEQSASEYQSIEQQTDANKKAIQTKERDIAYTNQQSENLDQEASKDKARIDQLEIYIASLEGEVDAADLTIATLEQNATQAEIESQNLWNQMALLPPDDGSSQQATEQALINQLAAQEVAHESGGALEQPVPLVTMDRLQALARKMFAAEQEHLGNMAADVSQAAHQAYNSVAGVAATVAGLAAAAYNPAGFMVNAMNDRIQREFDGQPPHLSNWNPFAESNDK